MAENYQDHNYMLNDLAKQDQSDFFAGTIVNVIEKEQVITFATDNGVLLAVHILNETIFRMRYLTPGINEKDFSYGIDPSFTKKSVDYELIETPLDYQIKTSRLSCKISKNHLKAVFIDEYGNILNHDEKGFHWEYERHTGNDVVKMSKMVQGGEHYYGLGDKSSHLDLRGKRYQLWGADTYAYNEHTDPLYKNIPFYIGFHKKIGYGIFFDNSFRSYFDFGLERSNVTSFWAHGGEMNYYFILGPYIEDVICRYTELTGKPELPPLWALGYHQCKWSYYPESKVKDICDTFRKKQIPCDAIYLDIDYMDGFRCFTWNKEYFPDPKKMIRELDKQGFKTIVIIDPGIKIDPNYSVHQEGIQNDYFCKRADGPLMKGSVWPGLCNFPDFTREDVRVWWADLFEDLIKEKGVRGIWNDMNEPAVFEEGTFPDDVRHDYDGNPCSHKKAHNVYGMQMARATYDGVKKFAYPDRPFVITRSGYSGVQRYSSVWTGDNVADWNHLSIANRQCQRLSVSGISFCGSDIGGFIDTPDGELYVRWLQMAIFHPFCRTHTSGDYGDQEPWSFGEEYTLIAKKFIELRYRFLPYIYTVFWQYVNKNLPMLKPLSILGQYDPETYYRQEEFGLGYNILVAPVTQPKITGQWLYLPTGEWYSYWNDTRYMGEQEIWTDTPIDQIPFYIRAGAVVPMYPIMQYVGEKVVKELDLHVYYKNGVETSTLFEDAGNGYEYTEGMCNEKVFNLTGNDQSMMIEQSIKGSYTPTYPTYRLLIHGLDSIKNVVVDGKKITTKSIIEDGNNVIELIVVHNFKKLECVLE